MRLFVWLLILVFGRSPTSMACMKLHLVETSKKLNRYWLMEQMRMEKVGLRHTTGQCGS